MAATAVRVLRRALVVPRRRTYVTQATPSVISYVSVPGKVPLSSLTVGQLLDQTASKYPDQVGVIFSQPTQIRKTFAQLKADTDQLAAGLISLGLEKGDRVGIWGPNSYEWYLTHKAGMKAGLIIVNINPAYQGREINYCLNKVGVKALVLAEQFKTSNYYNMLLESIPELEKSDPGRLNSKGAPTLTTVVSMADKPPKGTFSFQEILARGGQSEAKDALRKVEPHVQFDDVCNIQFTSGTTGNPKGVMLSHHNIVNNGMIVADRFSFSTKDKLCIPVPLFHCFGSVVGTLAGLVSGATAVYPSPAFSPPDILASVAQERCTVLYSTPTMHIDILNCPVFPKHDVTSLRLAVTAGAVCPEELIGQMKAQYTVDNVASCYGMTETSPVSFQSLPDDTDKLRAETVGFPCENTEVKIVDKEGRIVPLGMEGEMCVRGYLNMLGYWQDADKTKETIDTARWLRTGDLTVMLPSGHARVVGRLKDLIIRGGENIYPREVEDFLHAHPDIQEAQVFGVPDPRMGEEVAAWVGIKEGRSLTDQDLRAFCKGKIAHYKIPKYIVFTKEFPKTTSGKVQKFRMREDTIKQFQIKDITHLNE
ncbi:medium-chain acyl-CoA ligase ACSF2, mitochondrial isoform X2 [Folsomia candida]|uniref:medium-chain acyl-CoA ligase ACSF2, mitochondrial isoform X2 n=1 Tax=Folsomia candida TaxID=158441 RepID=UPI000B8F53CA|nr:medium-chain acyl-CoA ligase ACSF2, mitochondrial isoform X2 [Folsomia candida]